MKIIAIDTATEACSAALFVDGDIVSRYELAPRQHAKLILGMLQEVLDEAGITRQQLDAVAFGRGPGAFTGLRIAAGVAQGLALAIDKPVIPVSNLAALAQLLVRRSDIPDNVLLLPALDARMSEVYWGPYRARKGEVRLEGEESVSSPDALLVAAKEDACHAVGSGWQAYHSEYLTEDIGSVTSHIPDVLFPRAEEIVELAVSAWQCGEFVDAAQAEPVYLRNNVALKKHQQGR